MAEVKNLQGEWKKLEMYAEELTEQKESAGAEAEKAKMEKDLCNGTEGNEIQWLEEEEILELEATKDAAREPPSSHPKEKRVEEKRPTEKGGRPSRLRSSEKDLHPRTSRPTEKDSRSRRSLSRRLDSEERHRQLRWLRNETWLTLNSKKKGATVDELLKNLSLDGRGSVESRIKTLGYPCLAAFLKSAYMQYEVEVTCQEGRTLYFSKAKKGSSKAEKKMKDSEKRMKELRLENAKQTADGAKSTAKAAEATAAQEPPSEEIPASQPEGQETVKADERPVAAELLEDAIVLKAVVMEPLPLAATESQAAENMQPDAAEPIAEEPKPQDEAVSKPNAPAGPEAARPPAEEEAPVVLDAAAAEAPREARNPAGPQAAVAMVNEAPTRHRAPAVSDLKPLEELLIASGPIQFSPVDADRRYKWQRRFDPALPDVAEVPAPAEPVPAAMRPVLEVALEALQRQPNSEALTAADIHRVLSGALVGKKVWTHEVSMRFQVKKISMDNAFEAEIRSQADFAARRAARDPQRHPVPSRAPHCPIDMPIAAVFLWKAMPLQLPWWPMLVARERKAGLWPLESAYVVLNEEQAPGQEGAAAAPAPQNPEGGNRRGRDGAADQEGGAPRGSGSGPSRATDQEGGALSGRRSSGRPRLDDRVKQMRNSGRFDFAHRIIGPERGLIVDTSATSAEAARRIEVRCAPAPRFDEHQGGTSDPKPQLRSLVMVPAHSTFAGAPPSKKPRSDQKVFYYVCEMCHKYHQTAIPPHAHPRFSDCPSQWGPSSSRH